MIAGELAGVQWPPCGLLEGVTEQGVSFPTNLKISQNVIICVPGAHNCSLVHA